MVERSKAHISLTGPAPKPPNTNNRDPDMADAILERMEGCSCTFCSNGLHMLNFYFFPASEQ
jgi:hypothetical protein